MADLYGSQDVTIRNDDGSKIVNVETDASGKQRLTTNSLLMDKDGHQIDISPTGRMAVQITPLNAVTVVQGWSGNNAPYKAGMWKEVLEWLVPAGYTYNPFQVQYSAGNSSSNIKATKRLKLGSFNNITQTFTDGYVYTAPDYGAYIDIYFTADVGTGATITVTYTNQAGTTGRTATYVMTSGSGGDKNGHIIRMTLQSGDIGVRDITNVTTSASGTSTFILYGQTDVFVDSADASGVAYTDTLPLDAFVIQNDENFYVSLQITSAATSAVDRMLNLTGLLVEG